MFNAIVKYMKKIFRHSKIYDIDEERRYRIYITDGLNETCKKRKK